MKTQTNSCQPCSLETPQMLHRLKGKVLERTDWANNSLTSLTSRLPLLMDPAYKLAIEESLQALSTLHFSMSCSVHLQRLSAPFPAWWVHSDCSSGVTQGWFLTMSPPTFQNRVKHLFCVLSLLWSFACSLFHSLGCKNPKDHSHVFVHICCRNTTSYI